MAVLWFGLLAPLAALAVVVGMPRLLEHASREFDR